MKVIGTDNFDRDMTSDIVVEEGLTREAAVEIADRLNDEGHSLSPHWYMVVADDYKLKDIVEGL